MITSDVSTVMRRDPMFLELFQREPEDETQQIFHTSSFENGVRRHVTKLMSSLQYVLFECENITFIIHLLTRTQVLTPSFHGFRSISLLEVTPNVHGLSQETLQSSQQDRIGTSPVRFEGNEEISDQTTHKSEFVEGEVREKYEYYFSRTGKIVLETHVSIVSDTIANLIGVIHVAASKKSFRYALMEHFPKSRYILDEEEEDEKITRRQRRRDIARLRNTADLVMQLMHVPDQRKHELVDCGLIDGHSEDMLGEISIGKRQDFFRQGRCGWISIQHFETRGGVFEYEGSSFELQRIFNNVVRMPTKCLSLRGRTRSLKFLLLIQYVENTRGKNSLPNLRSSFSPWLNLRPKHILHVQILGRIS